jgi:cystathionine beta-lyase/cystathionine gamma-synthase
MDSTSLPTKPALDPDAICEACGHLGAVRMGDRWLCPDCISAAGSCCPEFGAWDAWSSERSVSPRCYTNEPREPAAHQPGPSTLSIHAGTHHDAQTGGACSPVFTSTAFAFPNPANENIYPRYFNTPNQLVINRKLAALEGGEAAVTFGSGMAAISTLLLAYLKPGDHAIFQNDLYGGTVQFIHSDVNAGVVVASAKIIRRVTDSAVNLGGMLDAHSCAQLERGLKTLAVRMRTHNDNARALAGLLQQHPAVARVNYPGLPEHPDHEVAARQMCGFGGMLSFELRDPDQVDRLLSRLRLVMPALSLGGVESLICVPSRTSHRTMPPEERRRVGISDGLVRLSVGIEDLADLIADLQHGLAEENVSK